MFKKIRNALIFGFASYLIGIPPLNNFIKEKGVSFLEKKCEVNSNLADGIVTYACGYCSKTYGNVNKLAGGIFNYLYDEVFEE